MRGQNKKDSIDEYSTETGELQSPAGKFRASAPIKGRLSRDNFPPTRKLTFSCRRTTCRTRSDRFFVLFFFLFLWLAVLSAPRTHRVPEVFFSSQKIICSMPRLRDISLRMVMNQP